VPSRKTGSAQSLAHKPQKRLLRRVAKASDGDKAWFASRPSCVYRARVATAAEAELAQRSGSVTPWHIAACGPSAIVVTIVKQLAPGLRVRRWCAATGPPPAGEGWAAWAWERADDDTRDCEPD
jgi:hypothetical protein